jgi:hypothetical protein
MGRGWYTQPDGPLTDSLFNLRLKGNPGDVALPVLFIPDWKCYEGVGITLRPHESLFLTPHWHYLNNTNRACCIIRPRRVPNWFYALHVFPSNKMVSSNDVQRLFLQAIFSRGVLSEKLAMTLWTKCIEAVKGDHRFEDMFRTTKWHSWRVWHNSRRWGPRYPKWQ